MKELGSLDAKTKETLEKYGFDPAGFEELRGKLLEGGMDPRRNRLEKPIALPPEELYRRLPQPGSEEHTRLAQRGREAIEAGEVGVVILNGGMATRFGGVPKGATPALSGRTFLDYKLSQVANEGRGAAPALIMNSFATDAPTREHLKTLSVSCDVRQFSQMVSVRLSPNGEIFKDAAGQVSLHATGHGDFPYAITASGELEIFEERGGKYFTLSNVDNLGAALDPAVIGAHIEGGNPMTVELVDTDPGDVGGFPALVDGKVTVVEAFRIPESFDVGSIPVFNTNSFVFNAEVLRRPYDLQWFAVTKKVDSRPAVQFERLVGQMTDFVEVTWLRVPRRGENSRFVPIKTPEDLAAQAPVLEAILRAQGVI